jgi:hypothetical protein
MQTTVIIQEKHENKLQSIFHCNIRSLRNKLNYIADIIEEFDIVFFTETNINQCKMSYNLKDTISLTFLQKAIPIL